MSCNLHSNATRGSSRARLSGKGGEEEGEEGEGEGERERGRVRRERRRVRREGESMPLSEHHLCK